MPDKEEVVPVYDNPSTPQSDRDAAEAAAKAEADAAKAEEKGAKKE